MDLQPVFRAVDRLSAEKPTVLIAIDGRCGAGKTTLAAVLARRYSARVFHTDDFYLPFARRTADWRERPAANMDFDRLRREVLTPARAGEAVHYRRYRAHTDRLEAEEFLPPCPVSVLEGSYSLHPALQTAFDLSVFLTCSPDTQAARLQAREGENFAGFRALWIPLEEGYFQQHRVREACDLVIET